MSEELEDAVVPFTGMGGAGEGPSNEGRGGGGGGVCIEEGDNGFEDGKPD